MIAEDVLVIGVGPAGIASAYALEQAGIAYKVVDRATTIASTWHHLYPTLRLNTTRFFSHQVGLRFPLRYGFFPSGRQYHDYLEDYISRHNFNIHLGVEVYHVTPEDGLWRVESSEGVHHYPAVISATGIYNNPVWPDIPGLDTFKGLKLHAHDVKDPAQFTGKRLLVVGNGPSGVDIAVASGKTAVQPVHIAIRSGISLMPRYIYGLPKHAWVMLGELLPKTWCERLLRHISNIKYTIPDESPLKPFTTMDSGSAIPYRGPEFIDAVNAGKVMPVRAPMEFTEHEAILADGTHLELDAVVLATGYYPVLHNYLDIDVQFNEEPPEKKSPCDWELGPNGRRGWPMRDTSTHPNGRQVLGYPGLFLVGVFYKGKGAMYNFNVEAAVAAEQIQEYLHNLRRWGGT